MQNHAKSDIRRLSPKPTVHCSKQPAWPWQNPKHPTTGQQHCEVATNRFRRLTFGLPAELSVEAFEASNALKLLEWETRSKAWLFPKSEVTVCTSRGSKQAKMGCCSPPPCLQAHLRLQPSPSVNCDAIQEHRAILWSWRITTPNTLKNQWKRVSGTGALLAMSAIGTNPFASRNSASPLAWAGTLWHMRSTPSPLDHRNFPQQLHPLRPQRRKCRLLLDICKLQNLRVSLCSVPGHGRIRKIRQVLSVKDQEENLFARTLLETQPEIPSLIGTNRQALWSFDAVWRKCHFRPLPTCPCSAHHPAWSRPIDSSIWPQHVRIWGDWRLHKWWQRSEPRSARGQVM